MATGAAPHIEPKIPSCYTSDPVLLRNVKNFDVQANLDAVEAAAKSRLTRNLLVDFGAEEAWCCIDVLESSWEHLFKGRPATAPTRWIQVWGADEQANLIGLLTKTYGFSPRLHALMMAELPPKTSSVRDGSAPEFRHSPSSSKTQQSSQSGSSVPNDEEKAQSRSTQSSGTPTRPIDYDRSILSNLNNHDIVSSLWHWSSVDLGKRYICLGYNALHNVAPRRGSDRPAGIRIWNWLIMTDDETVILISERTPPQFGSVTSNDASTTRRNLLNVIHQLSKATELQSTSSVSLVPIRGLMKGLENASTAAGLLTFYLFDDWVSTYGLLTAPERKYSDFLNGLRLKMMERADIHLVNDLHHLGRQLAVLKLVYQSYELLVTRVIERHTQTIGTAQVARTRRSTVVDTFNDTDRSSDQDEQHASLSRVGTNLGEYGQAVGTYLSPAAIDRFERLNHRIRLYVLTEIEESIRLKDQLLGLNFNLITIKQSEAIERLTRITILLAKVTILVLPVSLLTAYFSMQIPGLNLTITKYWISFAVILGVSILGVLLYGKVTNTEELSMVYRPFERLLGRIIGDSLTRLFGRSGRGPKRSQD